jgi:hypothetical protein
VGGVPDDFESDRDVVDELKLSVKTSFDVWEVERKSGNLKSTEGSG